jgi:hypothetical protein
MNTFAAELQELIARHRDMPGTVLADLVDSLETEAGKLVEEINAASEKWPNVSWMSA